MDPNKRGALQHYVFAYACDRDRDGEVFKIGKPPRCPACGATEMKSSALIVPPKSVEVLNVTHVEWLAISPDVRRDVVSKAIDEYLGDVQS